jgi:hypothetical protein
VKIFDIVIGCFLGDFFNLRRELKVKHDRSDHMETGSSFQPDRLEDPAFEAYGQATIIGIPTAVERLGLVAVRQPIIYAEQAEARTIRLGLSNANPNPADQIDTVS